MYAEATIGNATILNQVIGYEQAAKVAKDAMTTGRTMIESAKAVGGLSDDDARAIFDPAKLTSPGILDKLRTKA
jgi:aspartate ammonia-lyase